MIITYKIIKESKLVLQIVHSGEDHQSDAIRIVFANEKWFNNAIPLMVLNVLKISANRSFLRSLANLSQEGEELFTLAWANC